MPLENFIITVFCLVDGEFKKSVGETRLRKRGFDPNLSDSEVITMEIVAEFLGIDTDKGAWKYFSNHWRIWFPKLGSRANFAKHAANLRPPEVDSFFFIKKQRKIAYKRST